MKVCMLAYSFYENDARIKQYATALIERGDSVDVIALRRPGQPTHSVLNGAIRVGRDLETRQRILGELSQMWTRLTGQPEGELLISLWENPAENVMEAGLIFPGLGQEQQWFEENRDKLTELGIL